MKRRLFALCLLMSTMISGCGNAAQGGKGQVSDIQSNENEPIEIISRRPHAGCHNTASS